MKIGFFGTDEYSVITLKKLVESGVSIEFVVTVPDKPKGRKLILTPTPVKVFAEEKGIKVYQPESLKGFDEEIKKYNCDVFVVISYGKIIPLDILNIPSRGSLNIHASLLPKFRGSCPIETAILGNEKQTGVTIIKMDEKMDHGPIVAMKEVIYEPWPPIAEELGNRLVEVGSDLLISILPDWIDGKIKEVPQDHDKATYTKKIEKDDGLIDLSGDPYKNFLKIQAYHGWPSAFFFKDNKRIKITKASFRDGVLTIEKVIPEGKKEMDYKN